MKIKTTADIHDDYDLPGCPDNLMDEMNEKKIPADGSICRKCEWDERCNEKWINFDDAKNELIDMLKDWNCRKNPSIRKTINTVMMRIEELLSQKDAKKGGD